MIVQDVLVQNPVHISKYQWSNFQCQCFLDSQTSRLAVKKTLTLKIRCILLKHTDILL